jgi:DNA-binding NtrC family response regulator
VVLEAANGEQALQLSTANRGRIQLLLADVVLPRLSRPQIAEQLAPTREEIRVIHMSGYVQNRIKRYTIPKGQCLFLQKPFTPIILLTNVREALDASKASLTLLSAARKPLTHLTGEILEHAISPFTHYRLAEFSNFP